MNQIEIGRYIIKSSFSAERGFFLSSRKNWRIAAQISDKLYGIMLPY